MTAQLVTCETCRDLRKAWLAWDEHRWTMHRHEKEEKQHA